MLSVFTVQLLRSYLLKPLQTRLKPFELPSMAPRLRNVLILLLVLVAMIWPFFAGRAQVDIATLVLIYVMLALGLNIVVGFAGLLDLGFVGFYAVGRSEEHTSELQSRGQLVCRLLLDKKNQLGISSQQIKKDDTV